MRNQQTFLLLLLLLMMMMMNVSKTLGTLLSNFGGKKCKCERFEG